MTDFKIRRGLYNQLFSEDGILLRDSVVLELGCWYLCTDRALLYLCIENADGQLDLKQINAPAENRPTTGVLPDDGSDDLAGVIIDAFVNEATGMLHLVFADETEAELVTSEILTSKLSNLNYATKDDIRDFITGVPDEYITETELANMGYITEQQVQNNFVTTEYIQQQGFVTSEQLTDKVDEKVSEVIQEKVDNGEIAVKTDTIAYDTF